MDQVGHVKRSAVIKRSILINSRKTSVSLENEFWHGLREIADEEHTTVPVLVEQISRSRDTCNLSSAIRIFVYNHFRATNNSNQRAERMPVRFDIGPETPLYDK